MLVFYIILFCSLFFGLSVRRSGFYDDFLGRKQTDAVKGLFIGMVFREGGWKVLALTTMLVLAAEAGLSFLKHGQPWWYNTMLCYPAGMCISLVKDKFTSFVQHYYGLVLGLLAAVFLFLHFQKWIPALRGLTFNAKSIVFMLFIVLVTMKVKTGNRFLFWAGACVFPIYIYQRLPMRAFRHWAGDACVSANPYLFILFCMVITGVIAFLYRHWQVKLK